MAVIVEKADSWKECNSCGSDKDVLYITVLRRNGFCAQGTQIALCKVCMRCLIGNFEDYIRGEEHGET